MAYSSTRNMEIVNSFMQRVHGFVTLVSCSLQQASLASCNMVNAFEWACYAHRVGLHIVTVTKFLHKSIFGDIQIFVASGQGTCAASIGTIVFFHRVAGKCKISNL